MIRVGHEREVQPGAVLVAALPRVLGHPRPEALVVRDPEGRLRAYLNRCQHLPVPLDGGSRRFFDPGGRYLVCGTHGARYRLGDGVCEEGPCQGERLLALPLRRDADGSLWIRWPIG
ncbi:MAG: Rieske (2Fe-2S) protein [Sandaracinaceae bacterium]